MINQEIIKRYKKLLSEKQVLIAVIYDWKGLKEENYLYTPDRLREVKPDLCAECIDRGRAEGAFSVNKTYIAYAIITETQLLDFFNGKYNLNIEEMKANNPDTDYDDWYWEFVDGELFEN